MASARRRCEMAAAWSALGSRVTLLSRGKLLDRRAPRKALDDLEFIHTSEVANIYLYPDEADYLRDCRTGELPQVSWLIPSFTNQVDEHPPADVSVGMRLQQRVIGALRRSPVWPRSAFLLTYDEHGGYFDHVPPPVPPARTSCS